MRDQEDSQPNEQTKQGNDIIEELQNGQVQLSDIMQNEQLF